MKYAFWGVGLIAGGALGLVFLVMFENITVNNESEYYVLRESVEASMYESIDLAYYTETGNLKIIEQKFVANCTRRFFNSISGLGSGYSLTFYDIMESPPKVSVVANNRTTSYSIVGEDSGFNVENTLSAILEFNPS